jgi:hypothetical protein
MPNHSDKQKKRALLKQWKAEQRAAARARLPLPDDQMRALFDMLDVELPQQGCDKSLRIVRAWCAEEGIPFEALEAWLLKNGGHCDCEVLANSEQVFLEATASER